MKTVQLSELEKQVLSSEKEVFSVQHQGKLIGYYYPVVDQQAVKQAKEEMDLVMEKVLAETGLTEEELVTEFMNTDGLAALVGESLKL